jgi:hypothetical protein
MAVIAPASVSRAWAHEGPPFPILMDQPTKNHLLSVWADPDIGDATFYLIVETPDGETPSQVPDVALWVEPVSGRLERVTYPAKRQAIKGRLQFEVKPYFDQRDLWTVGVRLVGLDRQPEELEVQVESTPPGYGPWDLAIYLFPFLLLGGLWVVAIVRRYGGTSPTPCGIAAGAKASPQRTPEVRQSANRKQRGPISLCSRSRWS